MKEAAAVLTDTLFPQLEHFDVTSLYLIQDGDERGFALTGLQV